MMYLERNASDAPNALRHTSHNQVTPHAQSSKLVSPSPLYGERRKNEQGFFALGTFYLNAGP